MQCKFHPVSPTFRFLLLIALFRSPIVDRKMPPIGQRNPTQHKTLISLTPRPGLHDSSCLSHALDVRFYHLGTKPGGHGGCLFTSVLSRAEHSPRVDGEPRSLRFRFLLQKHRPLVRYQSATLCNESASSLGWKLTGPLGQPWLLSQTPATGAEVTEDTTQSGRAEEGGPGLRSTPQVVLGVQGLPSPFPSGGTHALLLLLLLQPPLTTSQDCPAVLSPMGQGKAWQCP